MTTKKSHLYSLLFIIVCATGYLFDVLVFDKHLSAFDFTLQKPSWTVEFGEITASNDMLTDSPTAHYPYKKEFWDAARQGYNSQYLPHIFSGKPTSGQGVGIFSTSLFQFFMDIPNALDFSTWFRLILAALLMYIFLIQLGVGPAAGCLGAVAWTYNLHQIAWLMFPQHLATQLWLPLILGLNLLLLRSRSSITLILGLILAVILFYSSGYTQIVLYSFVFLGVFNTLYVCIVQHSTFKEKLKTWVWVNGVYLVAALFLLPDALWQTQEIAEGLRGSQDFRYNEFHLEFSISALLELFKDFLPNSIEVVRFLMPNFQTEFGKLAQVKNIFHSNAVEVQVYFGLIVLYLTVYGIIRGVLAKDRLLIVFSIMLLLCTALFNANPTIISLLNLIPFAGSGSYARIISLVLLCAITIAAFGGKYIYEDLKARRYAFVILPAVVIACWLFTAKNADPKIVSLHEFLPWMVYLGIFMALAIVLSRFGKEKLLIPLAVILTFAELAGSGYSFNTRIDKALHFPKNTVIQKISETPGDFRTALLLNHTGYQHNIFSYYDLSTLGGYETTAPNNYLYFMRHAYKKVHLTLNGILFLFDGNIEILRLLNTRFIVSNLQLNGDLINEIYRNDAEALYTLKDPLERVYCASDQVVNSDRLQIPGQLAQLSKTLDRPVIVTESIVPDESLTGQCQVSKLKVFSSKLNFQVDTDQTTIVFIPTNYHQYWRARINGEKAQIINANFSFMALKIEPGSSNVVVEFINAKLTLAAALLIILGMVSVFVAIRYVDTGWKKVVFIVCGLLFIGKSMMSVPGIMNTDVPERPQLQSQTSG